MDNGFPAGLIATLTAVLDSPAKMSTRVDQILNQVKNHKVLAWLLVAAISVIGVAQLAGAFQTLFRVFGVSTTVDTADSYGLCRYLMVAPLRDYISNYEGDENLSSSHYILFEKERHTGPTSKQVPPDASNVSEGVVTLMEAFYQVPVDEGLFNGSSLWVLKGYANQRSYDFKASLPWKPGYINSWEGRVFIPETFMSLEFQSVPSVWGGGDAEPTLAHRLGKIFEPLLIPTIFG